MLSSRHAEDALTHLGIDLPALTLSTTTTTASVQIDNTTTNGSSHSAIEVDSDSISDSDSDSKRQRLTRVCASESHVTQYRHDNKHSSQSVNSNISLTSNSTATSVNSGSTGVHDDDILGAQASQTIRNRIASLLQIPEYTNQSPSHGGITLTLCGMASISTALRLVQAHFQQILQQSAEVGEMVVFGFPYLDTLKLVQRKELSPGGYHFFGHGNESDLDKLEALLIQQQQLQQQEHHQIDLSENHNGHNMNKSTLTTANATTNTYKKIWAVFTEFPSNPLLRCPNLIRLSSLAKTYGFLIIVDDTIGSFCNVDLMNHSDLHIDILCTSLTKIFSGVGDAFAGSLVVNPRSICASQLRTLVTELLLPDLYYSDAITLEYNSRDYPQRAHKINCTAERLVSWLSTHPCTECVHYPTLHKNSTLIFDSIRRTEEKLCDELKAVSFESGYGCLFSIILREEFNTQAFFDALDVCKGPSLGTNFTLACPYTLLAHYTELPWAAEYGVSSRLVRVSVGLEEYEVFPFIIVVSLLYVVSICIKTNLYFVTITYNVRFYKMRLIKRLLPLVTK